MTTPHDVPPSENQPEDDVPEGGSTEPDASAEAASGTGADEPGETAGSKPMEWTSATATSTREEVALRPEDVAAEMQRHDFAMRWAVVLLAFLAAFTPIYDSRVLVHVKTGQYLAENGFLPPRTDVFSYTAADRPWINTSWLYDLALAGVYGAAGAAGLTVLKALLAACAFGLLVQVSRPGVPTWWGSVCAALALIASVPRFTALPETVTLLGVAAVIWSLHRWRQAGGGVWPWALVPVFLVWANVDPHVFVGLLILAAYGAGELAAWAVGSETAFEDASLRKRYWLATGGCVLAMLVNPFGWETLVAPVRLLGTVYPSMQNALGDSPSSLDLHYYPLWSEVFWKQLRYDFVAALVLAVLAVVSLGLNWKRFEPAHAAVTVCFLVLAALAGQELAAASLVFAAVATLNAQDWFRTNFSTEYTTDGWELAFSRGGRALTVVGLAAVAFLSVTGRLSFATRTGFGLHEALEVEIEGLRETIAEVPADLRSFNFTLRQGDRLVWLGRPVFADSRGGVFAGEEDLLALHGATREALETPPVPGSGAPAWKDALDRYEVVTVLPRLSDGGAGGAYFTLLSSRTWKLVDLGPVAAAFVRAVEEVPSSKEFQSEHDFDFAERAFQTPHEELPPRLDWAHRRSAIERVLVPQQTEYPTRAVLLARTFQRHLAADAQGALSLHPRAKMAIIYLACRAAGEALVDDPQDAEAYFILGNGYRSLSQFEPQAFARREEAGSLQVFRSRQAMAAYQQAVTIDPDHLGARHGLFGTYLGLGRIDLALRELDHVLRLVDGSAPDQRQRLEETRGELAARVNEVRTALAREKSEKSKQTNVAELASAAYQSGCTLLALELLDSQQLSGDVGTTYRYAEMLFEAGRLQEAADQVGQLERQARGGAARGWEDLAGEVALSRGNYARAIELWRVLYDARLMQFQASIVSGLPLVGPPAGAPPQLAARWLETWPVRRVKTLADDTVQLKRSTADLGARIAVVQIEAGQHAEAAELLEELLRTFPDAHNAPLLAAYLELLGKPLPDVEIEEPADDEEGGEDEGEEDASEAETTDE